MPEDKAFFTSNNSCDRTELMDNLLRKAKGLKERATVIDFFCGMFQLH
jgi:hypothetical protein